MCYKQTRGRRISSQWPVILTLLLLIPVGLGTKFYDGPGALWVQLFAGDIFYPMFWFFLGLLIFPQIKPLTMSCLVFLLSTAVEFTQLLNGPFLIFLRQSFFGRTLVGTSFVWLDIVYYVIGSLLALFLYSALYLFRFPKTSAEPKGHHNSL